MSDRQITLNEAIDLAVEQLGPIRRAAVKRHFRNQQVRARFAEDLASKLVEDDGCCELVPQMAVVAAVGDSEFTADVPFGIDPDKLQKFLEIIVTYLPKILAIILPLFASLVGFAVMVIGSSVAMAAAPPSKTVCNGPDCGGNKGPVRQVVSSTVHAATALATDAVGATARVVAAVTEPIAVRSNQVAVAVDERQAIRQYQRSQPTQVVVQQSVQYSSRPTVVSSSPASAAANSAYYQATNGFGHNAHDISSGSRSGVGWTSNPNGHPRTCRTAFFPWNRVRSEVHTPSGTYATEIRNPTGPLARLFR